MCKIGHGIPGQVCVNWLACQDRDERENAAQLLQEQNRQQLLRRLPVHRLATSSHSGGGKSMPPNDEDPGLLGSGSSLGPTPEPSSAVQTPW
jgi:hypothetical protein